MLILHSVLSQAVQVYSNVEMENFQLGYINKTINYENLSAFFFKRISQDWHHEPLVDFWGSFWVKTIFLMSVYDNTQGLYSLSERTSYRKISWSHEAARFGFRLSQSLWNLTGNSAAALPRCLSYFKRNNHYKTQSRGFRISGDTSVRRPSAYVKMIDKEYSKQGNNTI